MILYLFSWVMEVMLLNWSDFYSLSCALKLRTHSCANIGDHYKYFFETFFILTTTICCKSFVFIMIPDINARTRPTFNASQNENNAPSRINFGNRLDIFLKHFFQWGCYTPIRIIHWTLLNRHKVNMSHGKFPQQQMVDFSILNFWLQVAKECI